MCAPYESVLLCPPLGGSSCPFLDLLSILEPL